MATFTVAAAGILPLVYQWQFNGTNLTAGTNASLALTNVQFTNAGNYAAIVSNAYGSVTSATVVLTVTNVGINEWNFFSGNYIWSAPAIGADGTIYVGSVDSKLYAINTNGAKKWEFATGNWIYSSPTVASNGTIYIGSYDHKLYAVSPGGTQQWAFVTGDNIFSVPAIGGDGAIYFGSVDGRVYALNTNGTKRWDYVTFGAVYSSPSIGTDGTIYIGSDDGRLYALNTNGVRRWQFLAGIVHTTPAIGTNGNLFVSSVNNKVYCIHPSGTQVWAYATGDVIYDSSPVIGADGTIYVGSHDNKVYALNPNGTKKWEFLTGGDVDCTAAIDANGTIYIGSLDNKLYALNPDGTKRWEFLTTGRVNSSPALAPNGTIYFGSYDYKLYAVHGSANLAKTPWPMFRRNLQHTARVAKPTITTPPQNVSVSVGGICTFAVTAQGDPPLSYQWFVNGTNAIPGATNSVLAISNVQPANAGNYSVVVSNPYGSVTSAPPAVLTMDPLTPPVILVSDGGFGFRTNRFGFNLSALPGQVVVIEASTNLIGWTPVQTNVTTGIGLILFTDLQSDIFSCRFYRARLHEGALPLPSILTGGADLSVPTNGLGFNVAGVAGQNVVIESSTDLRNWTVLATNTLSLAPLEFSDVNSTNFPHRFYRLLTPGN